jgi:hypothetical protein
MIRLTVFILYIFPTVINCVCQDTIKFEPSVYYTKITEPYRGKDFASRVKYAREDIVFSEKHKRIEYCYYYDDERHCHGTDYILKSDSTLDIDGETWNFKKQGGKYFVESYHNSTYTNGFTNSLIPFEAFGIFTIMTADKIDTLWTRNYSTNIPSYEGIWTFYKTEIKDKIYTQGQIDESPTLLNGDTLKTIYLKRMSVCISEPGYYVKELKFIITKEGRVVNIEPSIAFIDLDRCPYYFMELITYLAQLGPFNSAKLNGKNINVEWTLKVLMNDESDD